MFRFRRRRNGGSVVLLILGGIGVLLACMTTFFGVPYSIARSGEVADLPRPSASGLPDIGNGEKGLFVARIPAAAPVNEQSLALFYVEERRPSSTDDDSESDGDTTPSGNWTRTQPAAGEIDMLLEDGRTLSVNIPSDTSFMNAETIELDPVDGRQARYVGYRPGRTLTIEGIREGDTRVSAEFLYQGLPEAYSDEVSSMPRTFLSFGLLCGCISLLMLGAGGVLRFTGR